MHANNYAQDCEYQQDIAPADDASNASGTSFDYKASEHVEHYSCLTRSRDVIRKEMGTCAKSIVTIGWHLEEVKKECGRGLFLKWLAAEFGWSQATAYRFMQVARVFDSEESLSRVISFEPSTLYLLAAPATPKEVREEVLARVDAGQKVPIEEIKDIVRQSKGEPEKRQTDPVERVKSSIRGLSYEELERLTNWLLGTQYVVVRDANNDPATITIDAVPVTDAPTTEPNLAAPESSTEPEPEQAADPEPEQPVSAETPEEVVEEADIFEQLKRSKQSRSMFELLQDQTALRRFQEHAARGGSHWIGDLTWSYMGISEDSIRRLEADGLIMQSPGSSRSYGIAVGGSVAA